MTTAPQGTSTPSTPPTRTTESKGSPESHSTQIPSSTSKSTPPNISPPSASNKRPLERDVDGTPAPEPPDLELEATKQYDAPLHPISFDLISGKKALDFFGIDDKMRNQVVEVAKKVDEAIETHLRNEAPLSQWRTVDSATLVVARPWLIEFLKRYQKIQNGDDDERVAYIRLAKHFYRILTVELNTYPKVMLPSPFLSSMPSNALNLVFVCNPGSVQSLAGSLRMPVSVEAAREILGLKMHDAFQVSMEKFGPDLLFSSPGNGEYDTETMLGSMLKLAIVGENGYSTSCSLVRSALLLYACGEIDSLLRRAGLEGTSGAGERIEIIAKLFLIGSGRDDPPSQPPQRQLPPLNRSERRAAQKAELRIPPPSTTCSLRHYPVDPSTYRHLFEIAMRDKVEELEKEIRVLQKREREGRQAADRADKERREELARQGKERAKVELEKIALAQKVEELQKRFACERKEDERWKLASEGLELGEGQTSDGRAKELDSNETSPNDLFETVGTVEVSPDRSTKPANPSTAFVIERLSTQNRSLASKLNAERQKNADLLKLLAHAG